MLIYMVGYWYIQAKSINSCVLFEALDMRLIVTIVVINNNAVVEITSGKGFPVIFHF